MLPAETVLPDGFKMTELGPLPEEWEVVRLGDVATVGPSRIPRVSRDVLPFIPMSLVPEGGREISQYELRASSDVRSGLVVSEGDLLLAKITPCLENGKQGIVKHVPGGWAYATTEVFPIRTNDWLQIEFLNYYLLQPRVREALASKMEGTTGRQRLPRAVVVSLPIPLPPFAEQRAIARVLRTVQRAKETTDGVIAALKELKKSLMQHLFTYGPVPIDQTDQVRLKETEIGPVPEGWEVARLHSLGQICAGGPAPQGSQYFGGTHPFVRVQHLDEDGYEVQRWDLITDEAVRRYRLGLFPAGAIVFPKSGASIRLEKRAVLARPSYLVSHLCAIVPNNDVVDRDFLFFALRSIPLAAEKAEGYPTLSLTEIRQRCVPRPPLPEQRAIAETLRTVDRKIEAEESRKWALEALFKTLLHHLMTGKVRVTGFHLPDLERTP